MSTSGEVLVVGPGFRFFGGLSVYTCRLVGALVERRPVSLITLDRLIPARLYPGGARVGQDLGSLEIDPRVRRLGTVDWYWFPTLFTTLARLVRHRPSVMVLQWWTAATLHTYLVLALVAKVLRVPVVLEFHETQDTGEAGVPGVAAYASTVMPLLMRLARGGLVHNEHDLALLRETYGSGIDRLEIEIAPHGPYDHLGAAPAADEAPVASASDGVTRVLCFGLIRPYKGTEDAIAALDAMTDEEAADFRLTIVGETWEQWTLPAERIAKSRHRDRIEFVNRYVTDEEAAAFHADADVVLLPYRRGSSSGPLHIAMSHGLHVILYGVGGLVEAVAEYAGAVVVEPDDVDALRAALLEVRAVKDQRFTDPHSWDRTCDAVARLEHKVIAGAR